MGKLMRVITALCGLGICVFGSALDSTEHFGTILIALIFCMTWCLAYVLIKQRCE